MHIYLQCARHVKVYTCIIYLGTKVKPVGFRNPREQYGPLPRPPPPTLTTEKTVPPYVPNAGVFSTISTVIWSVPSSVTAFYPSRRRRRHRSFLSCFFFNPTVQLADTISALGDIIIAFSSLMTNASRAADSVTINIVIRVCMTNSSV